MTGVSGRRPPRPFPALDPEPPRRLTWRSLRWPATACVVAGVVAAAFLAWPSSSPSASRPARVPFADRDGIVVFEEQPSGMLGTAAPDGSHRVMLRQVGTCRAPSFRLPSLLFVPSATQVVIPLVVTVALLAVAVTVATVRLIRSARPELLREAPP